MSRRLAATLGVLSGLVLSLLAASGSAAAPEPAWTPARDIPGTAGLANPGTATAPDGTDLLLWSAGGSGTTNIVRARVRLPGRTSWVDVTNRLKGSYLGVTAVQPTPGGDFWAAYSVDSGGTRTFVTRLDTSRLRWTTPVELFTDQPDYDHDSTLLALTRSGTLVASAYAPAKAASSPPVYRIAVATQAPNGAWKSRFVSPANEFSVGMDLGVNAKGDIVVGFIQGYALADMTVRAATRSHRSGRPWKVATLSAAGDSQRSSVAITPDGTAVVVWSSPANGGVTTERMATLDTTDALAPWVGRDVVTGVGPVGVQPYVVAGLGGAATVVWSQGAGTNVQLWMRHWDGAALSPATQLTPNSELAEFDGLVARPDGTALMVYQRFTTSIVSLGMEARVLDAGTAGTPVTLTGDFATSGSTNSEQVAVDAAGRGTLTYTHGDYPDTTFQWQTQATAPAVMSGPATGVVVHRAKVGGTPRVGRRVSCRTGYWVDTRRVTYRWTRDGHAINGATTSDYRIVAADKGHQLACSATGRGPGAASLVLPGKARRVG